jgi:hypothetical protein
MLGVKNGTVDIQGFRLFGCRSYGSKAEKSRKQERFVLRLVKSANIEDEATVRELIAPENLELLKAAMTTKFFYSDIKYVSPEVLKLTLDTFPMRQRAEFIAVVDSEIKSSLLAFFEDGSKIREMLNSELELIEKNPDRSKEVQKQKPTLINKFMNNLRTKAVAKPSIIDEALISFAKANNIETPEWLVSQESEAAA